MVADLGDYGVYADAVEVDFETDELTDSDNNSDANDNAHQNANQPNCRKNMTDKQKKDIYEALLERSARGKLQRTSTSVVADLFHVSQRSVQRVWNRAKKCRALGQPVDVSSRKPKNAGRKKNSV